MSIILSAGQSGNHWPIVGHILYPRPGVPWTYIGRSMPRFRLRDEGWGNPFTRRNCVDPVGFYFDYLASRSDLLVRLPELVGRDLLCWCRKPGMENDGSQRQFPWVCHGDPLMRRVHQWETEHRAEAAAIRERLGKGRHGY